MSRAPPIQNGLTQDGLSPLFSTYAVRKAQQNPEGLKLNGTFFFQVHGSVHRVSIRKRAQLDVTLYRFILSIKYLYMFRAFLAHLQE
jgi:hypothetical protein